MASAVGEGGIIDFHSGSYFSTILEVSQSWDVIRKISNYEDKFSALLYKKFLELEPSAIDLFHFTNDNQQEQQSSKYDHPLFYEHCVAFVKMLDLVIHLLGPDVELVEEILLDLGGKNLERGVMQETYKPFGNALLHSLQELLLSSTRRASTSSATQAFWSESKKKSWNAVYNYMTTLMTEGANNCEKLKMNQKQSRRHSCFV